MVSSFVFRGQPVTMPTGVGRYPRPAIDAGRLPARTGRPPPRSACLRNACLLYTSDAADDM
eukprot:6831119-Prorocentrum_lima.AAC.1